MPSVLSPFSLSAWSRSTGRRAGSLALAALLLAASPLSEARAATSPAGGNAQAQKKADHKVEGFRSARFGMTEKEVRKAITSDFKIKDADIARVENRMERTFTLIARKDNLIPKTGTALIVYLFGYESKKLIQVNVLWGQPVEEEADPATLITIAEALSKLFLAQGYAADSITGNIPLDDGSILVFRGRDAKGRMTAMTLDLPKKPEETKAGDGSARAPAKGGTLRVSYIENPENPDVFSIDVKEGAF